MTDPKLRPGTKHCKCAECKEYFTTVANFDLHRQGRAQNRRCVYPGDLVDNKGKARLRHNAAGLWAGTGGIYKGGQREG